MRTAAEGLAGPPRGGVHIRTAVCPAPVIPRRLAPVGPMRAAASTANGKAWQSDGMARSNSPAETQPGAPKHLRPELEVLVLALAALPEPEFTEVYAAVTDEMRRSRGPRVELGSEGSRARGGRLERQRRRELQTALR